MKIRSVRPAAAGTPLGFFPCILRRIFRGPHLRQWPSDKAAFQFLDTIPQWLPRWVARENTPSATDQCAKPKARASHSKTRDRERASSVRVQWETIFASRSTRPFPAAADALAGQRRWEFESRAHLQARRDRRVAEKAWRGPAAIAVPRSKKPHRTAHFLSFPCWHSLASPRQHLPLTFLRPHSAVFRLPTSLCRR